MPTTCPLTAGYLPGEVLEVLCGGDSPHFAVRLPVRVQALDDELRHLQAAGRTHCSAPQEGRSHSEVSPGVGEASLGGLSKPGRGPAAGTGESRSSLCHWNAGPRLSEHRHFLSVEAAAESSGSGGSAERKPSAARGSVSQEPQVDPQCVWSRWQCSMTAGGEKPGQDPLP